MDCFLKDLRESRFLQTVAALVAFYVVLLLVYRRPGAVPPGVEMTKEERLANAKAREQLAKRKVVETAESRALLKKLRNAVVSLDPERLGHLEFRESWDTRADDKRIIYICLRDPATGKLYDWNPLVFALIHEVGHCVSKQYDPSHTTLEFQTNFWTFLRKAEAAGIYDPKLPFPPEYCGLEIDANDPGIVMR